MKRILFIICILVLCSGCSLFPPKKPINIWWGAKGDEVAWEKAKEVMQNYNWVVLASDLEQ
jgi:hypothetical protein